MKKVVVYFLAGMLSLVFSCQNEKSKVPESLFTILGPEETGIDFRNDLQETLYMNGLFYEYLYNGAGVAVGDFNNDELPDIYFVSNLKENKLYINRGDLRFEAAGKEAGLSGKAGFPTGVTTVDINGDGLLDIY
ncbi:MAG: VCBS repeat-containing protein, partial [Saprospiraceae bacterium]|nr:VCBS repeat-containing protein [Saprospiraceae bacterium]